METVAFHSFKGGVGRTSAALNFARAVASAGQNVLLLELDVDAPGVRHKPGLFNEEAGQLGYVDYLAHFHDTESLQDNIRNLAMPTDQQSVFDKISYLKEIAQNASLATKGKTRTGQLKIISSGSGNDRYWWNLNSNWFNSFFSVSRNEYSDSGLFQLHTNKSVFEHEKRLLERVFSTSDEMDKLENRIRSMDKLDVLEEVNESTDFLVIDCKSAREYACVPLYYWCDVAVLMFPFNYEGIVNAKRMYTAVRSAAQSVKNNYEAVKTLPVICRTPPNFFEVGDGDEFLTVEQAIGHLNLAVAKSKAAEPLRQRLVSALDLDRAENVEGAPGGFLDERAFSIQEVSKGTVDEACLRGLLGTF